jgi:hypothetical protein
VCRRVPSHRHDELGTTVNMTSLQSVELLPEQVEMLRLIWQPIPGAGRLGGRADWPVWDFVARELYRIFPHLGDAKDVLLSLPTLPAGRYRDRPYGLIWRDQAPAVDPQPGEKVGLTIAGLRSLAQNGGVAMTVPDQLANLIGELARWDAGTAAKPHEVVSSDVPLSSFTGWFQRAYVDRTYVVPDPVINRILQSEYAPVTAFPFEAESDHRVQLGRISLRRYLGVTTADGYLECISQEADARQPVRYFSPLTLIQTFDYLSYVLAADPAWQSKRLTIAPDLQSAAALSAQVNTRHEFETALSGLCTVIDQLSVPEISTQALAEEFQGKPQPSVNRFSYWLRNRLGTTEAGGRSQEAIGVLRAVRAIRVETQHGSTSTRCAGLRARQQLGLPEAIVDWSSAWQTIHQQLAGALDVIRQEVQTAGSSDT